MFTENPAMIPYKSVASEDINIVLTADINYAMPLATTVSSVAYHADQNRRIFFHIIHSDFSLNARLRVELSLELSKHPHACIQWIPAPMEKLASLRIVHYYMSSFIYARLLIPELLPESLGKVLYLDCDIVALEDISTLWDSPMGAKSLCAVRDRIGHVGAPGGLKNHEALGIDCNAHYFNSGVMLMDLNRWRALDISQRVIEYLNTHSADLQMGDQDGLNAVLHDDWLEIAFQWNWQIVPRVHRTGPMKCWVPVEPERSLLHFSTFEKPWRPGCQLEERRYFFEALDRTAWAGWRIPMWQEAWVSAKQAVHKTKDSVAGKLHALGLS